MLKRNGSWKALFLVICVSVFAGSTLEACGWNKKAENMADHDSGSALEEDELNDANAEIQSEASETKMGRSENSVVQSMEQELAKEMDGSNTDSAFLGAGEDNIMFSDENAQVMSVSEDMLVILQNPQMYTYENLAQDAELLPLLYPNLIQVDSLGTTLDGRALYHFVIGDQDAVNQIFISAGIHAREYITCQLVMKQTVTFLQKLAKNDTYGSQTYQQLMENSAIHVVPMINPDGVSISQLGLEGIQNASVLEHVKNIAQMDGASLEGSYLVRWKSNANGVDLNRNFDALWESYHDNRDHFSSDHYKGTNPGSEIESAALIQLTEKEKFSRIVTYHSQGSVIYWYFGQSGELLDRSKAFAERIAASTGYYTDANYQNLDPAGYKDWAIDQCGIPSITIEVGRETSPVPIEQFEEIWLRNESVWEETLLDSKEQVF